MKLKFYFLLIILSFTINAQVTEEWFKIYNGPGNNYDRAFSVAVDGSGNVYITGPSAGSGTGYDYATIKYSATGVQQWIARYSGPGNGADMAYSIAVDDAGNVYVTGSSIESGTNSAYATIKYNSAGVEQWASRYHGPGNAMDEAYSIAVDSSGNVYVTGKSIGSGTGSDYATIKYNSSGTELWVARFNGLLNAGDDARSIAVDGLGNVYVTGNAQVESGSWSDYTTIKYSSGGAEQWVAIYNGPGNESDVAYSLTLDSLDNVYVTGDSWGIGTGLDYTTIKYSSGGGQQWVARYNGPGNVGDQARSVTVDGPGNVYVTGFSGGIGTGSDYATIKYNSAGDEQWVARYNGPGNYTDDAYRIAVDGSGDVYVTGYSGASGTGSDFATIKYNSAGAEQWVKRYDGTGNNDAAYFIALDGSGNVYVTGYITGIGTGSDFATIKYSQGSSVYKPAALEKWISGETNTIKWHDQGWSLVNIKCILNFETLQQTEYTITQSFLISNPEYVWEIPDTLLSFRSKIFVENASDTNQKIESGVFRLKPYVLTRVNDDSTYYAYDKASDQWGFSNTEEDMWPSSWYDQFNYQGIDPFTGISYNQIVSDSSFAKSRSHYHPDWISWVNAFTIDACYFDTTYGIYKPTAVLKWRAIAEDWGGSCFGIAIANSLAFGYKEEFINKYPLYPNFVNPITVTSDNQVKKVINELYTHQLGNPHLSYKINIGLNKTPTNTLAELKNMLQEDKSEVRTLSLLNNGPDGGGHAIVAYGLEKDTLNPSIYYVKVYDNQYPSSDDRITIYTNANGGNGVWLYPNFPGWGGDKWLYLRNPVFNYLFNPTMVMVNQQNSPFILDGNELQIVTPKSSSIKILDQSGNVSGFINNIIYNDIPGSAPLVVDNGSKTPPYGYSLLTDNYSVVMNNFSADTVEAFFFTGNKSFMYERYSATQTQTDRLYFDGGVSVSNPDAQTKPMRLLNIINETTQEKLCVVRSLELVQNDSVKIENPDSNKIKLISYGSAKDYDIELNYVFENGWERFGDFNIPLLANTSHTFVPNWPDIVNNDLIVLVDIGNNGTIDDTLFLQNQVTGVGDDQGSMLTPGSYNLAQNYPNPFNPVTFIRYQLPISNRVTLKVYDILGNEVATLVNEEKPAGSYEINFNAINLSSGVYFYRLQAGSFMETKKMTLIK